MSIKLSRSENLPALPNAVIAVLRLVNDYSISTKAIETILEKDSGLAAKLLRAANSSYYGGYQVHSIERAVSVLGFHGLKSLILALSFQTISAEQSSVRGFDKIAFWQHSFATATAARILGKLITPVKSEEFFTAAMMHDIGLVVMERYLPDGLSRAIELARIKNIELHEAETEVLGFDHAAVGGVLAERWGLPLEIQSAIRYHHAVEDDMLDHDTTSFVSAANTIAHQCGFSTIPLPTNYVPEFDFMVLDTVDLPEEQLVIVRKVVIHEVDRAREHLMISAA